MLTKTKSMEANVKEIWKDVVGYEGIYQISNYGSVKSIDRQCELSDGRILNLKGKLLKPSFDRKGYIRFRLSKNDKLKSFRAHRLTAKAFIPNHRNSPQVNHKNGVKHDNFVDNLEWATNMENSQHSWDQLGRKGSPQDHQKKPVYQVSIDGFFIAEYESANEAFRSTGVHRITAVARGERKTAGGYKWYY